MTNTHRHISAPRPFISARSARDIASISEELQMKIDAMASEVAMQLIEDSRNLSADWMECDDCDEIMHEAHDEAMGMVVKSILSKIRRALI